MLYLLQQHEAPLKAFKQVLREVLEELDKMPARERQRWLDFLVYIHALLYHVREPEEQESCRTVIEKTVKAGPPHREMNAMFKSTADVLKEEGRGEGEILTLHGSLLRLMTKRFKKVPRKMEKRIRTTTDVPTPQSWLDNILDAETIEDVGVPLD